MISALEAALERESSESPVLVVRQPVVDEQLRVVGHRIAYAGGEQRATDAVGLFNDVVGVVGLEALVGNGIAHLPVSRELLLAVGVPPIRPDRVVLRISFEDARAAELRPVLEEACMRGYCLELDEIPGPDVDEVLLDLCRTVEVDFARLSPEQIIESVARIRVRGGVALGCNLHTHAQRDAAASLGCHWFTGPFYATPRAVGASTVPVGDLSTLVQVARLQSSSSSIDDLITLVRADAGLSVRLLRFINSAYFGFATKISSIRQAAVLLGPRAVSRWALLVTALSAAPKAPRELTLMALTRAQMCERIAVQRGDADPEELFTVGLLSMLDALVGAPLETIVSGLPLTSEVSGALLHRAGVAGSILEAVLAYEHGSFSAPALRKDLRWAGIAYRGALSWAREASAVSLA